MAASYHAIDRNSEEWAHLLEAGRGSSRGGRKYEGERARGGKQTSDGEGGASFLFLPPPPSLADFPALVVSRCRCPAAP
eukprot:6509226-Pyramimonas_sp.AAC.1